MKINKHVLMGVIMGMLYGGVGWLLAYFPLVGTPFLPALWTFKLVTFSNNLPLILLFNVSLWIVAGILVSLAVSIIKKKTNSLFYSFVGGIIFFIILIVLILSLIWLLDYLGIVGI